MIGHRLLSSFILVLLGLSVLLLPHDNGQSGEIMKFEYQRKVALLNKQKKHGANPETLEKIKAAVSHLHTRYIVDMQAMDATVSEINHLRDEQLHPKLVALVDA